MTSNRLADQLASNALSMLEADGDGKRNTEIISDAINEAMLRCKQECEYLYELHKDPIAYACALRIGILMGETDTPKDVEQLGLCGMCFSSLDGKRGTPATVRAWSKSFSQYINVCRKHAELMQASANAETMSPPMVQKQRQG